MLCKVDSMRYPDIISVADAHKCGRAYPLSIAEGIQEGEIFTDAKRDHGNLLFWSYCGFAYLSENVDECFLEEIYELMVDKNKSNDRRFLLMTSDKSVEDYFRRKEDVVLEKRYLFDYFGQWDLMKPDLPAGYELKEIDGRILGDISGGIVPSLFWKNADDFLMRGKGYCITCGHNIASWAFSAAVSSKEIDIGIETNPEYKQRGFGVIVAEKMIQYTVLQEKKPVWACHYKNVASKSLAEKLGFIKTGECSVIKHEG